MTRSPALNAQHAQFFFAPPPKHATLEQWRDRWVRGAKPASAVALQTAPRVVLVAARFFGDTLSHRVFCTSHPMALGKKWKTEIKMAQFAQRPLEGLNQKKRSVFIMNRRQLGFAMNQETSVLLQEFVIVSVTNWAHPM
jgi:hypothetical protein